jgi:hypothetical protein
MNSDRNKLQLNYEWQRQHYQSWLASFGSIDDCIYIQLTTFNFIGSTLLIS